MKRRMMAVLACLLALVSACGAAPAGATQPETPGTSRGNPIAPGDTGRVVDFDVQVLDVTFNAEAAGLTTGTAPADDHQFVVARIAIRYDGTKPDTINNSLGFDVVGGANLGYSTYYHGCATDESADSIGEFQPGDAMEFSVCWEVTNADAADLVMYVQRYYSFEPLVWFSVGKDGAAGHASQALTQATPALVLTNSQATPVPLGSRGQVAEVQVAVEHADPDAAATLARDDPTHAMPDPGKQYFMVTVAITNVGPDLAIAQSQAIFGAVGASGTDYTELTGSCGVIPNVADKMRDTFPGGTVRYNLCWEIAQADAASLVMYAAPLGSTDTSHRIWLALHD